MVEEVYGDRLTENFGEVIVTNGGSMGRADKVKSMYRYNK